MNGAPNIPGLPAGPGGIIPAGIDALIGFGGAYAINLIFGNRWGIFNEFGVPVLLADNVTSVDYQATSSVANAPVEKGTFASYNKVQDPYTASVVMTKGGGDAVARGAFIAQLEALSKSTLMFNVLTPEYVHRNAQIVGWGYRRRPNDGNRIIIATIDLKEIREVSVQYVQEAVTNPEDQPTAAAGDVDPVPAGESALSAASTYAVEIATELYEKGLAAFQQLRQSTVRPQ